MSAVTDDLEIYLVGGAVRDQLLGYAYQESDWVVVGSTPEELLRRGFRQVGKDFPVFLHPETGEEYALARTERKSGHGYGGFEVHAAPTVTLEEDLARRDLTINAIARSKSGQLVDPFNGQIDLNDKVLKHVSSSFSEDPLRVLRVARFLARYHHLGFSIAPDTLSLMRALCDSGELEFLVAERVWRETERALSEPNPEIYFSVLQSCGALAHLFERLDFDRGIPVLARAAHNTSRTDCRWAALLSTTSSDAISSFYRDRQWPKRFQELALVVASAEALSVASASETVALLSQLDAWRRDEPFKGFCDTLIAIDDSQQMEATIARLTESLEISKPISIDAVNHLNLQGPDIGRAINAARVDRIQHLF